jgi:hypothetical protein
MIYIGLDFLVNGDTSNNNKKITSQEKKNEI